MTIQSTISVNNGVNTEALIGARGAFAEAPQAAQFTFRSSCSWIEGTYSANKINGYFGLGQEHERVLVQPAQDSLHAVRAKQLCHVFLPVLHHCHSRVSIE